jgi:hypothetical protein
MEVSKENQDRFQYRFEQHAEYRSAEKYGEEDFFG